jgi:hypothetical protein
MISKTDEYPKVILNSEEVACFDMIMSTALESSPLAHSYVELSPGALDGVKCLRAEGDRYVQGFSRRR